MKTIARNQNEIAKLVKPQLRWLTGRIHSLTKKLVRTLPETEELNELIRAHKETLEALKGF